MGNVKLIDFNMEEMTSEQLEQIQNKARDTRLKKLEKEYISINGDLKKAKAKIEELDIDIKKVQQDNEKLDEEIKETKENLEKTQKDYENLKDVTYVLATDDCKSKELTKSIKARVHKFTGTKDTPTYILFYRYYTNSCYGKLYSLFEIASYKRIKIDNFDLAMKAVSNWFPTKKLTNDKLLQYQKLQDKGFLPHEISNALDKYLEEINGGLD